MCLCVLIHREAPTHPLIMAANREERYSRTADPPAWIAPAPEKTANLAGPPAIFAGRDHRAGGTWQGINGSGLLVALTNRRSGSQHPDRRSRGQLCLDVLRQPGARAAADWLREHLAIHAYNPCNLLCVDAEEAFAAHHDGAATQILPLAPGLHLLTDTDVDDPQHPRIRRSRDLIEGQIQQPWPALRRALERLMADHADAEESGAGICIHGETGGTVSSAIIVLPGPGLEEAEFLFAEGPPCTHPYADLTPQLLSR